MTKSDPVSGVKCFSIAGRMVERRQRCLGMTDEERRWRAQWLKDQVLSNEEPRFCSEYYRETNNIFRRLYKTPMLFFERVAAAKFGPNGGVLCRSLVGKLFLSFGCCWVLNYVLKYHSNDFVTRRTIECYKVRESIYPYDQNYPNYYVKTPQDYYHQGFCYSVLCQDVEPPEPPPPPPPPPPLPEGVCPATQE